MNDSPIILDRYADRSAAVERFEAASKSKRFFNFVIDMVGYLLFAAIFGILIALLFIGTSYESVYLNWANTDNGLLDRIFGAILIIVYYTACEYFFKGKTLGKLITGTRAVTLSGESLDFKTTLARSASRIVPFEAFSFLGNNPGWHDKWSDTRVVDERKPLSNSDLEAS